MKKVINKLTLRFPSKAANESFARAAAAAFAAQLDPTVDQLNDFKTAVSEAVTNSIVHGYRDSIGQIIMSLTLYDPPEAEAVIKDKGAGIIDVKAAMTPMYTTGGPERSGMGFTIMQTFTDKLKVSSRPGKGVTVKMSKKFDGKK